MQYKILAVTMLVCVFALLFPPTGGVTLGGDVRGPAEFEFLFLINYREIMWLTLLIEVTGILFIGLSAYFFIKGRQS